MAEAANGPVTPLAETMLEDNDVVILPDLLLNAVSALLLIYWTPTGYRSELVIHDREERVQGFIVYILFVGDNLV